MTIRVGCCGFPVNRPTYFRTFSVVELQQTFYQPPDLTTIRRWREQAPPDFEFSLKAWQLITHEAKSPTYKKLRHPIPTNRQDRYGSFRPTEEVFAAWEKTREIAEVLKARIIIFQSPASFSPIQENKKNLRRFFTSIEREAFLLGWEPRGDWRPEEIRDLCAELDLIHVVDPFQAESTTLGLRYFRLHGIGGYRYRYTLDDLKKLKRMVEGGPEAYVMLNNVFMLEDAKTFLQLLGQN